MSEWISQFADKEFIEPMRPIIDSILTDFRIKHENNVMKAVGETGIRVDKGRLMQALTDAQQFYEEGYRAAIRRQELFSDELMPKSDLEIILHEVIEREKPKWISVKERLPEKWQNVLVSRGGKEPYIEFVLSTGGWERDDIAKIPVTHWMPLPEPPVVIAENATASEEG